MRYGAMQVTTMAIGLAGLCTMLIMAPCNAMADPGYVAHVASYKSAEQARRGWEVLRSHFPDQLQGKTPEIRKADLGAKGTFFRLLVAPPKPKLEIEFLCQALSEHGQHCRPMKSGPGGEPKAVATRQSPPTTAPMGPRTVGRWCDTMVPGNTKIRSEITITSTSGGSKAATVRFPDGSQKARQLSELSGGRLLVVDSNTGDQYRISEGSGDLELSDRDGYIRSARRLENSPRPGDCLQ